MNWKRATISAMFAVPVIALFAWGFTRDPRDIPSPLPGRAAPPFTLTIFSSGEGKLARPVGDTLRLARLRDTVVVMNFYASWCLACRDEHAVMSQVAQAYAGKPVQFVGVLYNDTPKAALDWIKEMGGQSYPATDDAHSRVAIDYGLYGVPETFFIDGAGRVAYKQTGPATVEVLTRVIDSLLSVRVSAQGAPAKTGALQ